MSLTSTLVRCIASSSKTVLRPRISGGIKSIRRQSNLQAGNINSTTYPPDEYTNTPPSIVSKIGKNLHLQPSHPIGILRKIIESHFSTFTSITPSTPIVSVWENFDELGFASDHPGRSLTDSYYLNKTHMLRTHTSAHEVDTFRKGHDKWLLSADVYRRDEIDSSHYPAFHQMEGAHIWEPSQLHTLPELNKELASQLSECNLIIEDETKISPSNPYQSSHDPQHAEQIAQHLKHSLNSLIFKLFGGQATKEDGEPLRIRWIEAFFPFTTPSYEVEIWWNGEWLEILGSGVVMQKTLETAGVPLKSGWAFGLGLERIAMVLFQIPDIRLFWSEDPRFLNQFSPGKITTFKPYSKYPPCYKDISFWLPASGFHENNFCEIVRDIAGDLVENVTLIDDFVHPKTSKQSKCYRLNYRSMDRSLSNEEVNALQAIVEKRSVAELGIELR